MRFSLIVPACNVAPYAARSIASLRGQSFADFEAIIVNEESSDGTREVLEHAVDGDARFQTVTLPRSGSASVSRNYGMEHAAGDYLVFVDGDDWLETDALQKLDDTLHRAGDPDIGTLEYINWCERTHADPERSGGEIPFHRPGRMLSGPAALTEFLRDKTWRAATWRYVYRRDFLLATGLRQSPGRRHQDDEWTYRVVFAAAQVWVSDVVVYNYLKRAGSVTTKRSDASMMDIARNLATALEFWNAHEFSRELGRLLGHQNCIRMGWFFGPHWCGTFARELRRRALGVALPDAAHRRAWRAVRRRVGWRDWFFGWFVEPALRSEKFFKLAEWMYRKIYGL